MSRRWHHWRPRFRRKREKTQWQPEAPSHLENHISRLKHDLKTATGAERTQFLEKLLVLQTPRAAAAQQQMDQHHGGYRNREERLYELIDFNDTFVSAVMAQPHDKLKTFVARMKHVMKKFCELEHSLMFTDKQFDAIVRGLAREIAVYLGAKSQGFRVGMTSRSQDAFGIDMIVRDETSGASINIDVKTPSAFRHRLDELEREKRITSDDVLRADKEDFVTIINRHNDQRIPVTILCVRPERLGDVVDFRFQNEPALANLLRKVMAAGPSEIAGQQRRRVVR